jgi:hypothetical protein
MGPSRGSILLLSAFEAEGELFDDGVGENLGGDAFDLVPRSCWLQTVFEGEEKVFALADVVDAFVLHAAEGVGDGLTLGVEDRSFECYVDMSLHHV